MGVDEERRALDWRTQHRLLVGVALVDRRPGSAGRLCGLSCIGVDGMVVGDVAPVRALIEYPRSAECCRQDDCSPLTDCGPAPGGMPGALRVSAERPVRRPDFGLFPIFNSSRE